MRLAVFGGTGHTGRHLLEQALQQGHTVTALARDPNRLTVHERLHPQTGDVRDTEAVKQVVAGSDAVLSALGQRRWRTTVCTDGMRTILPAMKAHGVHRLIAVSGYGVADSRHRNLYVTLARIAIRSLMQDKEGMEARIKASETDWTIVRPAILTDGPHTGHYRAGSDLRLTIRSKISYADVADFMLAQLARDDLVGQAVAITS
ncbi:SDR family oxidoreductase [Frankia sp. AgB1.9]|uniref:NAD(P)-dependent oxidoreductase n=1 Tax=unclassified Frankia TaxID=2632575 RepID=UPI00193423A5|nr:MULTISPECIES: SDR family oxidoreductase [unclassified Frankia]MBL7491879.1 SDR family oxidoreductase [Frankia sp. AgW1.1]MBL7551965.1 SDR family oxidoreductase [Frankia sp. AgB1.9]MBL7623265.1 SDR family oxidoreductase [Frankia sp. AgB1.8]